MYSQLLYNVRTKMAVRAIAAGAVRIGSMFARGTDLYWQKWWNASKH